MAITDDGQSVVWLGDHGASLNGIASNPDGDRLYIAGGAGVGGNQVRKLNLDSSIEWSYVERSGAGVHLDCGPTGRIVTTISTITSEVSLRLRESSNALVWEKSISDSFVRATLDGDDNVYATTFFNLKSYDSSGTLRWTFTPLYGTQSMVFVKTNGSQVVVGGPREYMNAGLDFGTTQVFDTDGNRLWFADHGATVFAVGFCPNGNVIAGGGPDIDAVGDDTGLKVYNSSGTLQWSAVHSTSISRRITAVASDGSNNVYAGGHNADDVDSMNLRKYSSSGTLLWSFDWTLGSGAISSITGIVVTGGYVYLCGPRVIR